MADIITVNLKKMSKKRKIQYGKLLGETLLKEISLPVLTTSTKDTEILDAVPKRNSFTFQEIAGDNPVKKSLAVALQTTLDGVYEDIHVCAVDGVAGRAANFPIDHSVPVNSIEDNQEKLITFLEDNPDIAEGFLQAEIIEKDKTKNMQDYFVKVGRKIKGKWLFYRTCYNNETNLTVLCAACNSDKSDKEPLQWYASHLGEEFLTAVNSTGSMQEGIIFKKIVSSTKGNLDAVNIGEKLCVLEDGIGLGKFINDWSGQGGNRKRLAEAEVNIFRRYRQSISDLSRKISNEKDESKRSRKAENILNSTAVILDSILTRMEKHVEKFVTDVLQEEEVVGRISCRLSGGVSATISTRGLSKGSQSSGDDTEETLEDLQKRTYILLDELTKYNSGNKRMKRLINEELSKVFTPEQLSEIRKHYSNLDLSTDNPEAFNEFFSLYKAKKAEMGQENKLTVDDVKGLMDEAVRMHPTREGAIARLHAAELKNKVATKEGEKVGEKRGREEAAIRAAVNALSKSIKRHGNPSEDAIEIANDELLDAGFEEGKSGNVVEYIIDSVGILSKEEIISTIMNAKEDPNTLPLKSRRLESSIHPTMKRF